MIDNFSEHDLEYYQRTSVKGIKWSGITEVLTRFVRFITTVILARILLPQDFGEIALAIIFIQFVQLIIDLGISTALIQRQDLKQEHYNASFSFLFLISIAMVGVTFLGATFIGNVLGNPKVIPLIYFLSIIIPFSSINLIPRVYLTRRLYFRRLALVDFASTLGYAIITIFLGWWLRSVWSFVFGLISEQIIASIFLWSFCKWRPVVLFNYQKLKDLLGFGSTVFSTRLLNFFSLNIPQILIQQFFGSSALGYFTIAFQLIDLPTQRIAKNIMKVMLPILSRLQKNPQNYHILYLDAMYIILTLIFPIYILIYLFAEPLVLLLYGEKWLMAAPLIRLLAVLGLVRSIWTGISVVSLSMGKPQFELRLNLLNILWIIPIMFILKPFGIIAVVGSISVVWSVVFFIGEWKMIRWMRMPWLRFVRIIRIPILGSITMILLYYLVNYFYHIHDQVFLFIFFYFIVLTIAYLSILIIFDREYLLQRVRLFWKTK